MDDQIEASYRRQEVHGRDMELPSRFTAPGSVDNWRHDRMLDCARPLVQLMPAAQWLTVGDGAYGSDAAYLRGLGAHATASSLVDDTLRVAADRGYIGEYRAENAERLSLPDDGVDFVLCKAAYHHFPRPPIALYEMLRVARVGVVLIEPVSGARLLDSLRHAVKVVVRGDANTQFEPAGNFIYRIDIQELAKLMTAAGEAFIAYRPFNDFYMPGLGDAAAAGWTRGYMVTRLGIAAQNLLCRIGLLAWGLAGIVLLKGRPEPAVTDVLRKNGYTVQQLPVNPYAAKATS